MNEKDVKPEDVSGIDIKKYYKGRQDYEVGDVIEKNNILYRVVAFIPKRTSLYSPPSKSKKEIVTDNGCLGLRKIREKELPWSTKKAKQKSRLWQRQWL